MRSCSQIFVLLLLLLRGYSQTDCFKFTSRPYNIIPNPSFELAGAGCTSAYVDQFGFSVPGWFAPTNEVFTGYLNACTNFLIPDSIILLATQNNPHIALFPIVPLPIPDGKGVIAVSDYGYTQGTRHVYPKFASYIATCLPVALEKDSLFHLEFQAGFGQQGDSSMFSYFHNLMLPQLSQTPEKFSLFGLANCPPSSVPILGCMQVEGWYLLGSCTVSGTRGKWEKAAIDFKAPDNIVSIALGASCDTTVVTTQGDFVFNGKAVHTVNYGYFLDALQLYKAKVPFPTIHQKGSGCDNSVKLQLSTNFYAAGYSFQWFKNGVAISNAQDSILVAVRNADSKGWYQCLVQNDSVCLKSDSLEVAWLDAPTAAGWGAADTLVCTGDTLLLAATSDSSFRYSWQDGSQLPNFTVRAPGSYSVSMSNACGSATREKTVHFGNCVYDLFVPNAFTPNGDGHNDLFRVRYSTTPLEFQLVIFNRYGQRVYSSADPTAGWNGRASGSSQATGTYIWSIYYVDRARLSHSMHGTVVLIR